MAQQDVVTTNEEVLEEALDIKNALNEDEEFIKLLKQWNLSQYAQRMEQKGWDDPEYWKHLNENILKNELGFQSGHIIKFKQKVKDYNTKSMKKSNISPYEPLTVKLCMLGDTRVGKSSICIRYCKGEFDQYTFPTIGATFLTQSVSVWNFIVKFEIWDTAGQERFRSLAPLYYRGASAALCVYDITDRETFENALKWVKEVQTQEGNHVVIGLAGNKVDLAENRKVSTQEAIQIAKENKYIFFETSAKTSENIKEIFTHIAMEIPKRQQPKKKKVNVDLEGNMDRNKGKCKCQLL